MIEGATRVAIDIETVSPNHEYWEKPDFRDPCDFELLAVALAYQGSPGSNIQTQVFLRDGWAPDSELALIYDTVTQLEAAEAETYLTYNGEEFDFVHLRGRARLAAEDAGTNGALAERIDSVLSAGESDDLKHDAWKAFGKYTTLEDACAHMRVPQETPTWRGYDHGLDADDYRVDCDKGNPLLTGADVAQFGEHYLDWCDDDGGSEERRSELEKLLHAYAVADVVPLFELADSRPLE
jgi:hypothetical protein